MKIADCFLLAFHSDDILAVINSLQSERKRLNLHVIHNNSSRANILNDGLSQALADGLIDSWCFFHRNIAAVAFGAFFDSGKAELVAPYSIISDGDILPSTGWLDEHISILQSHKEAFSVSISLDMSNLPGVIPTLKGPTGETDSYVIQRTGWCFKTFSRIDWISFLRYRQRCNLLFHDNEVHQYARNLWPRRLSVVTKQAKGLHLRWNHPKDADYNREKKLLGDPWRHQFTSPFTRYTASSIEDFPASPARINHQFWRKLRIKNSGHEPCSVFVCYQHLVKIRKRVNVGTLIPGQSREISLFCAVKAKLLVREKRKTSIVTLDLSKLDHIISQKPALLF